MNYKKLIVVSALSACCVAGEGLRAQPAPSTQTDTSTGTTTAASTDATGNDAEKAVVLSPFTVTTDKDEGYRATNSISGTRLNTAIKDLPMPIEVITDKFLRDTGSTDLRQSLRYSSGILLQTQNDYAAPAGSYSSSPGKVNNPEGLTASPDMTHMKIRGFETESVLRDGFRRQNATDSVNISRVEIARGPASLLYGVGNFGGVVNYLVKQPTAKREGSLSFAYGSYDFMRGTLDLSGPVTTDGKLAYRLTGAAQRQNSYTDFDSEKHFFISPVITWRPFKDTEIYLDLEGGKQRNNGIGWQDLRSAPSGYVNEAGGYDGGFYAIPGRDPKTFRWSGPDTYRDSTSTNVEFKVTQNFGEHVHLLAGIDRSTFNFAQRDNLAAFINASGSSNIPAWAIAPITYSGLAPNQTSLPVGPTPSTIEYQWEKQNQYNTHVQGRVELNIGYKFFENGSKWLRMDQSLLGGFTYTKETNDFHSRQTAGDLANFHSPTDYSYFRYGKQGDGSADKPEVEWDNNKTTTSNPAFYAVYQGKYLDDRLTLIGGIRRDRSWNRVWQYNPEFQSDGTAHGDKTPTQSNSLTNRDTTHQYGASLDITPGRELSVYVMHSEGVEPNYQGKLDLYGNPLQAAIAKDNEVGLKFDLFNGRISGTVSKFEIIRSRAQVGSSSLVWFAPVARANTAFNPKKDIVYNVNDLNPYNGGAPISYTGMADANIKSLWDAGVAAGKIYQKSTPAGATNWYLDAGPGTGPGGTGADYMDAVFKQVYAKNTMGWWGWIYGGADPGSLPYDPNVNNATMDDNGAQRSVTTGSDKSSGWDTQILLQPMKNLQVLFTWSHIEKVVLNAAAWPKYPYPQDRWAIWYAPISWSATAGRPLNEVYTNPQDTSTYITFGTGLPMDDTPRNQGSAWVAYDLPKSSPLKGLTVGLGAQYEGARIIYPAYGRRALDTNGNTISLSTRSKTIYNAMVRYGFMLHGHESSLQLNIDNLLNDQKLYGWIYQAPRRWQLQLDYKL